MGNQSTATIIIKAKDEAGNVLSKISLDVTAQLNKTTQATEKLDAGLKKATESTKKKSISLVDVAAKLYLVQTAIRGVGEALEAVYNFGKLGATVEQTAISFQRVVEAAGGTTNILKEYEAVSRGTIATSDLMQATNQALVGTTGEFRGAMLDALPALLEMARASSILNPQLGDTTQQFDRLTLGLKRLEPRILDDIGIELRLTEVNRKYAEQLGKTSDELTTNERSFALLNAVMEKQAEYVKLAGDGAASSVDPYMRLEAAFKNLKETLAMQFNPTMVEVVHGVTGLIFAYQSLTSTGEEQRMQNIAAAKEWQKSGGIFKASGDLIINLAKANGDLAKYEEMVAKGAGSIADANKSLLPTHRAVLDAQTQSIEEQQKAIDAQEKFEESRTKSLNSLFMKELQINERRVESQKKITDKIEDLESDLGDKLRDIWEDAERDRTRITSDAAEDRAAIELDYTKKIADANKDISELYDELAGRNPFLSQDTQTGLSNAEAMVDGLEDRLRDLRSQQRHNPDDETLQNEIANVRDQLDMANELYADAKDSAREEERRKRLEFQIAEKQALLVSLEAEKQAELASINAKEQEKLAIVNATQAAMTTTARNESLNRRLELESEFRAIAEAAQKDIAIATTDAFLGLVDANSKVGQSLFELQAKNYGASDSMIKDFIAVRESIDSPSGITAALQSVGNNNSFGKMISQAMSLNTQLATTVSLVNSLGGNITLTSGGSGYNGRRAAGGSVAPNGSYLVGENGPEVLNMGSSGGSITPNHALGGGGGNTIIIQAGVFNGSRADAEKLAGWIGPILDQRQERFGGAYNASGTRRIQSAGRR